MTLSAERMHEIFMKCLFKNGEDTTNHIAVNGLTMNIGFHPGRIEENKAEIIEMLDCLPDNFKVGKGGGWSFLNMCNDKEGNQWADSHRTMEELVMLGLAIDMVDYNVPRPIWSSLPGSMPYIYIKSNKPKS
jgi:hypothetical protein